MNEIESELNETQVAEIEAQLDVQTFKPEIRLPDPYMGYEYADSNDSFRYVNLDAPSKSELPEGKIDLGGVIFDKLDPKKVGKVLLSYPWYKSVEGEFATQLLLTGMFLRDMGIDIGVCNSCSTYIAQARDMIIGNAPKLGVRWVVQFDNDLEFPAWAVYRMLCRRKPFVFVPYIKRADVPGGQEPTVKVGGKLPNPNEYAKMITHCQTQGNDIIHVEHCGAGAMLIHVPTAYKVCQEGWFKEFPHMGEDVSFCYRINNAGYGAWADFGIETKHTGRHKFEAFRYAQGK